MTFTNCFRSQVIQSHQDNTMPNYQPNTSNTQASFVTFPKDSYEFKIRGFKPNRTVKEVNGVQQEDITMTVNLICVSSGPMQDKKASVRFTINDPEFFPFFKQFMMAAYGYTINAESEERFNEEVLAEKDDSFDPISGELGSYYKEAVDRVLVGHADITIGKAGTKSAGKEFNQWRWQDLKSYTEPVSA